MDTLVKSPTRRRMPGITTRPATYAPKSKTARATTGDAFLHSLADEIQARGLPRPCINRAEILAAIDGDNDTTFLIKTKDLENIVLSNLTQEGLKNPAESRDDVMRLIKSESECFAQGYILVNTEVFEDAMLGVMMEDSEDDESVSEEEVLAFLRQR